MKIEKNHTMKKSRKIVNCVNPFFRIYNTYSREFFISWNQIYVVNILYENKVLKEKVRANIVSNWNFYI